MNVFPQVLAEREKATEENASDVKERVFTIRFNFVVAVAVVFVLGMQLPA